MWENNDDPVSAISSETSFIDLVCVAIQGGTMEQYNAGRLHSEAELVNYLPVGAGNALVHGEPSAQKPFSFQSRIFPDQTLITLTPIHHIFWKKCSHQS